LLLSIQQRFGFRMTEELNMTQIVETMKLAFAFQNVEPATA